MAASGSVAVQVSGTGGVQAAGASAAMVNLLVAEPTADGWLTAFANGRPPTSTSSLNFLAGQAVPNLAVLPVGTDGRVRIVNNSAGTVQLIADVYGLLPAVLTPRPVLGGRSRRLRFRLGTCQCWAAVPLQSKICTRLPSAALELGTSRHFPELMLRTEPSQNGCQHLGCEPLQSHSCSRVPLALDELGTSRHLPRARSDPASSDQVCAPLPLQSRSVRECRSRSDWPAPSRHLPASPITQPDFTGTGWPGICHSWLVSPVQSHCTSRVPSAVPQAPIAPMHLHGFAGSTASRQPATASFVRPRPLQS